MFLYIRVLREVFRFNRLNMIPYKRTKPAIPEFLPNGKPFDNAYNFTAILAFTSQQTFQIADSKPRHLQSYSQRLPF